MLNNNKHLLEAYSMWNMPPFLYKKGTVKSIDFFTVPNVIFILLYNSVA
jgi:hypothetical protein